MASRCKVRGKTGLCIHHWLIDAKDHGFCIKCGEGRQFFPPQDPGDYAASTCWAIQRARKQAREIELT